MFPEAVCTQENSGALPLPLREGAGLSSYWWRGIPWRGTVNEKNDKINTMMFGIPMRAVDVMAKGEDGEWYCVASKKKKEVDFDKASDARVGRLAAELAIRAHEQQKTSSLETSIDNGGVKDFFAKHGEKIAIGACCAYVGFIVGALLSAQPAPKGVVSAPMSKWGRRLSRIGL